MIKFKSLVQLCNHKAVEVTQLYRGVIVTETSSPFTFTDYTSNLR